MVSIADQAMQNAIKIISRASDRELSSQGYSDRVYNASRISSPKLNLEQTKVKIEQEELSYRNIPPGVSFSLSGNNVVEYAIYKIPILGDKELFR